MSERDFLASALACSLALGKVPEFEMGYFNSIFEAMRVAIGSDGCPETGFERDLKDLTYRLSDGRYRVSLAWTDGPIIQVTLKDGEGRTVQEFQLLRGKPFILP